MNHALDKLGRSLCGDTLDPLDEGAFLLARALRSTETLLAAGRTLAPQYVGIEVMTHVGIRGDYRL